MEPAGPGSSSACNGDIVLQSPAPLTIVTAPSHHNCPRLSRALFRPGVGFYLMDSGRGLADPEDAADLRRRGQAGLDRCAGAFPAMDHPRFDGDPLELPDVAVGEDGARQLVRLEREHL